MTKSKVDTIRENTQFGAAHQLAVAAEVSTRDVVMHLDDGTLPSGALLGAMVTMQCECEAWGVLGLSRVRAKMHVALMATFLKTLKDRAFMTPAIYLLQVTGIGSSTRSNRTNPRGGSFVVHDSLSVVRVYSHESRSAVHVLQTYILYLLADYFRKTK